MLDLRCKTFISQTISYKKKIHVHLSTRTDKRTPNLLLGKKLLIKTRDELTCWWEDEHLRVRYWRHLPTAPEKTARGGSDDVFEAVGGIAGQGHASAATAQVLAVRPLHVDVPLLLLADAASLRTTLSVV